MHGKLRALALMVGLSALPLQVTPTFAESCDLIGANSSFTISDGTGTSRSWRFIVDGVVYQSDTFDMLEKQKKKKTSSKNNTLKVLFVFKDEKGITRSPNDEPTMSVSASIQGEINENQDSGTLTLRDRTTNKKYRIDDPSGGLAINCG
ncbi:MAG: hypothetical protein ACKVVP_00800 [Chloroflexota bacterium]